MRASKLVKLLKLLSSQELKRFRKLLQSPFYTHTAQLIPLFDYLKKYHPTFEAPRLSKEKAFWMVYQISPYDANKINKLMTEMTQLIEQFLIILETEADAYRRQKLLTESYGKREAYDLFSKNTQLLLKHLDKQTHPSWTDYLRRHLLIEDFILHPSTAKQNNPIASQEAWMDNMDLFFVRKKLWMDLEFKVRKNFVILNYDFPFLENILELANGKYKEKDAALAAYIQVLHFLEQGTEEEYFKTKHDLLANLANISFDDQKHIFGHLLNFGIALGNKGDMRFRRETFELYKIAIKRGYLLENGKIHDSFFTNIASLGALFGEFEWTKQFINRQSIYLAKTVRTDVTKISLGILFFFQQQYQKTLTELLNYPFNEAIYEYRGKFLIVRCYFELFLLDTSYFDTFFSAIQAFVKFIKRNKYLSSTRKEHNLQASYFLKKIGQLIKENQWSSEKRNNLIKQLEKTNVAFKSYLMTKLKNL